MDSSIESRIEVLEICESVVGIEISSIMNKMINEVETWDSLAHLEIILSIESRFQIQLQEEILGMTRKVNEFIDAIVFQLERRK